MKNTLALATGIALATLGTSLNTASAQDAAPEPKTSPAAPAPAAPAAQAPAVPAVADTDVVLQVDDTPITVMDVRELFTARYGDQFEAIPAEQRALIEPQIQQMVMSELIEKTLLSNAAEKEGVKVGADEVQASLDKIATQLPEGQSLESFTASAGISLDRIRRKIEEDSKVRKLLEKVTSEVAAPTESETKKYFDEHPEEFEQKESVDAAHILISTQGITDAAQLASKEKIAKELREEITSKKGANFAEMAGLHSDCPSKAQGGDLGEFERGQMVPEFEKVAFLQEIGTISDLVKTDFGYHIIKVNGRKEAKTLGYDEVKTELLAELHQQAKNEKMSGYVKSLRDAAKITQPGAPDASGAPSSPKAPGEGAPPAAPRESSAPDSPEAGSAPAPKDDTVL